MVHRHSYIHGFLWCFLHLLPVSARAAGGVRSYTIVDTGQTGCYGNAGPITCPHSGQPFYGQDSQCHGSQPAYKRNGNGTVTDLNTGLMWVQARGAKVTWDAAVAGAPN
ncbi:MAG: hypothetical protein HY318_18150, partial [Armatimonadetes bacterium]|nr:hypothetical protein [Armatimonadota bacterium]